MSVSRPDDAGETACAAADPKPDRSEPSPDPERAAAPGTHDGSAASTPPDAPDAPAATTEPDSDDRSAVDDETRREAARNVPSASLTPVFHGRSLIDAGLSREDIEELRQEYARGQMDLSQRAEKLRLDAVALEKAMETLVAGSSQAHDAGLSVTTTHSRDSDISRTEIVIGNTGLARGGKSAGGMPDRTLVYIVAGSVCLVASVWLLSLLI